MKVIIGIVLLSLLVMTACVNTTENQATGNVIAKDAQILQLGFANGNYELSQTTVQIGKPITLQLAEDLPGCARSVTIPEYGLAKIVKAGRDNTLTFTPTKKGPVTIACSMNMYNTKLIVE